MAAVANSAAVFWAMGMAEVDRLQAQDARHDERRQYGKPEAMASGSHFASLYVRAAERLHRAGRFEGAPIESF
jgi:hypothetical protein